MTRKIPGDEPELPFGGPFTSPMGKPFSTPYVGGSKEKGGTSEEAGEDIKTRAATLMLKAMDALRKHPNGLTADEVAAFCWETPFAMRPRITELFNAGQITKGPDRRKNKSGKDAWVWRVMKA